MVTIIERVNRPANQAVPPTVSAGVLSARPLYTIATASSPDGPRWWRVVLAPLTGAFDGQEMAPAPGVGVQGADSWARISFGDGQQSPMYLTWPEAGGQTWVFGAVVRVEAMPSIAVLAPAAPGPSWGVMIDGNVEQVGDRQGWLGFAEPPIQLNAGATTRILAPPYARAVRLSAGAFNAGSTVVTMAGLGAGAGAPVVAAVFPPSLNPAPFRWELDPRIAKVELFNPGLAPVLLSFYWEVAL